MQRKIAMLYSTFNFKITQDACELGKFLLRDIKNQTYYLTNNIV